MSAKERLDEVAATLRQSKESPPVTVRDLLMWFGAQRRGYWIVQAIREGLDAVGLATEPDFESAYIDSSVRFLLERESEGQESATADSGPSASHADAAHGPSTAAPVIGDPTYRISKLKAANTTPTSVKPDAAIQEIVTIMLQNDFSQLPVMTSEREVKGVVSWTSIGTRLALRTNGERAGDFMDIPQEIRADSSLFDAIPTIVSHQYVLVRGTDGRIVGIVTASDLSSQFQQLAEPFLLLGEIENHIRNIADVWFTPEMLAGLRNPNDSRRVVARAADLTLGEYVRLFEKKEHWAMMNIPIDRVAFCSELDRVRAIRNDIMHFDPDGIPPDDLTRLRNFARFLQRLQSLDVV